MKFSQNYFELFALELAFDIDSDSLNKRFRELQRTTHPDRFVKASDQERRLALQKATQVNEAFQVLNNPVSRSQYLLKLHGVEFDGDHVTIADTQFLMQQMELRETLEGIPSQQEPLDAIVDLINEIDKQCRLLEGSISELFESQQFDKIKELISEFQFFSKLRHEAVLVEEDIEDNLDNL